MAVLFGLDARSNTVQRRAISPSASMGLGVLIGAIVVAGLATFAFIFWRRHRWQLRPRSSRGRVAHLDATHSLYFPYEDDAHAHEKFPVSPFVAHHAELMAERPVLHITHSQPAQSTMEQQSGSPIESPATAALDRHGRWNGRMPRSPSSADALLRASPSPHSAGSGPPSGSGSAAARTRARTPPLTLELNRVLSDPAQVRQSIGGTAEVTIGVPAPVVTRDESRRERQRRRNVPVSIVTAEDALEQSLSTSAAAGAPPLPNTSAANASSSRHPFSDDGNSPSRSRGQQDASASGSGRRSSTEKRPMLVAQNVTTPTTPAPRYSLWGRLSSIGGLLHGPPPPTALPEYNSTLPSPNPHPSRDEGNGSGAIAMAPYTHARSDSQGRLVPPERPPPPTGPPPMPPAGSSSGTAGGRR